MRFVSVLNLTVGSSLAIDVRSYLFENGLNPLENDLDPDKEARLDLNFADGAWHINSVSGLRGTDKKLTNSDQRTG